MKHELLKNLIHRLIEVESTPSPLISCFVNLDEPRWRVLEELDSRRQLIEKRLGGQRRVDFADAFEEVESYLKQSVREGSRSAAIYSRWGDDPVMVAMQFQVPLRTNLIVDELPHIYPLIELKDTYHRFVIVITTETEARILETTIGSITEEILAKRPELRKRVGREWTREHYHSHRTEQQRRFIRDKVQILERLMSGRGHNHLVIAGNPRMAARLMEALPARLRDKVVSVVSANPKGGLDPILVESLRVFVTAEQSESHDRVQELENAVFTSGLGVAGYVESLAAMRSGYADLLIIDQDFGDAEQREELVRTATEFDVSVETVADSLPLKRLAGVGCLLRYLPYGLGAMKKEKVSQKPVAA